MNKKLINLGEKTEEIKKRKQPEPPINSKEEISSTIEESSKKKVRIFIFIFIF